ncbi:molybdopterin guanine dinucleotide biosynthesis protein MoaE [Gallibacterium salpingitidis]|uniref:Molybdopterin synthase catalytic subunit n=1 Tax=Gallibacterium salpingitidis TaxID=505341 RepID=A0AB36E3V2_9PAST|nr:molybdopterin synthase catalytic subunit MoaE [Gallibacterium salpingitidis]OBX08033.1 molybdopterin guanine dinucleotide biosynthesis protein MoaE [Gallibacterium salpingitidis]OBX11265.1 molybdopterin guanine dinucleotide biosynthesis protein MoaE [Gallibacterium salpingitidis]WKT00667.1 molybdopterin synthase catalytic subunit MoaE [Gallibacterium salpingitidis]
MTAEIKISVQNEPFDQQQIYRWTAALPETGATVVFIGKVRDMNLGDAVSGLYLEHYPAMTAKALQEIAEQAAQRWQLQRIYIVHRVGQLYTGDEIVAVAVSSAHRGSAYQANEFIMDFLKVKAPFWKKETTAEGDRWLESRHSDEQAADKW